VDVVATVTGDGRVDDIRRMHGASLNVVQCSGSMAHLATLMRSATASRSSASPTSHEDTARALYDVAGLFPRRRDPAENTRTRPRGIRRHQARPHRADADLRGKKAALYVGGGFKAISLVRALRTLGMVTVLAGTQTGNPDDYEQLREVCDPGTILVDDTNPLELCAFLKEKGCDMFIGGVKERPIAYKMGLDSAITITSARPGWRVLSHAELRARGPRHGDEPRWKFAPRRPRGEQGYEHPTHATKTATQNACKLCEPLGACFVFRGIEGAIPLLHGSQGCATYIRPT